MGPILTPPKTTKGAGDFFHFQEITTGLYQLTVTKTALKSVHEFQSSIPVKIDTHTHTARDGR